MGRLIAQETTLRENTFVESPIQNTIEKNVQKLIENSSSKFTVHLEEKPTFVLYYHREISQSTQDRGLENVQKKIGHHSPNMFNKIHNFPIFGIEQLSVSLTNDNGLELDDYGGDATIIPGTIKPLQGDYFVIEYIGQQYLFEVKNVLFDQIKSQPFYKIEYSLERKIREEDFKDSIYKEYDFIYKNIGTDNKPMIEMRVKESINLAYEIYESLLKLYLKYFFANKYNCFLANICIKPVYNSYLMKFMKDNALLKFRRGFFNEYYIEEFMTLPLSFSEEYRYSPYALMEMRDPQLAIKINKNRMLFQALILDENPFVMRGLDVYTTKLVGLEEGVEIWSKEFLEHIYSNTLFNQSQKKYIIPNMFIEYLNGKDTITEPDYMSYLNSFDWFPDMNSYVNIPFILKMIKDQIEYHTKQWKVE